jgi:Rap1a immunity proteins
MGGGVTVRPLSLLGGTGLIVAAVLGVDLVHAERINRDTADRIMPGCRELAAGRADNAFNRGQCLGLAKILFEYASNICPPDEIQNDQIVRAIVQYIDSDPARLKENFNVMAIEAMRKAWPCKR